MSEQQIDDTGDKHAEARGGFRLWMLVPALGAAMVLAVFMLGLQRDNAEILPSPLIDKQVPEFALSPLREGGKGLSSADLEAPGVKLVNIWASWCGPCRAEHPQLIELGESGIRIGTDSTGRTGIEFGVYGVPETFVVDGDGTIVYKHVGPVMPKDIERFILPAIEKARAEG